MVTSAPTPTWQTNGRVNAIAISNGVAYIGGSFTAVRPAGTTVTSTAGVTRTSAAAIDLTTGALLSWDPQPNGTVRAIAVSGNTVYLGGVFTTVDGAPATSIAAVTADTAEPVQGWSATMDGSVLALATAGGDVFAGGTFTSVDGAKHNHIAALSTTTGAPVSGFAATTDDTVKALAVTGDGARLILGGSFDNADAKPHANIAAISVTTGAVTGTAPSVGFQVLALAANNAAIYVGGGGTGGNVAAYDPATGVRLWRGGTDGNVQAMSATGSSVYVGGHFEHYCGAVAGAEVCKTPTSRSKLFALNASTGALRTWNPHPNSVHGVFAAAAAGGQLATGGDFTRVDDGAQQGFATFPPS